jgi:DnaJ-class molecular chaperone
MAGLLEREKIMKNKNYKKYTCPCCTGDGIGADITGWVKCPTCKGRGRLKRKVKINKIILAQNNF